MKSGDANIPANIKIEEPAQLYATISPAKSPVVLEKYKVLLVALKKDLPEKDRAKIDKEIAENIDNEDIEKHGFMHWETILRRFIEADLMNIIRKNHQKAYIDLLQSIFDEYRPLCNDETLELFADPTILAGIDQNSLNACSKNACSKEDLIKIERAYIKSIYLASDQSQIDPSKVKLTKVDDTDPVKQQVQPLITAFAASFNKKIEELKNRRSSSEIRSMKIEQLEILKDSITNFAFRNDLFDENNKLKSTVTPEVFRDAIEARIHRWQNRIIGIDSKGNYKQNNLLFSKSENPIFDFIRIKVTTATQDLLIKSRMLAVSLPTYTKGRKNQFLAMIDKEIARCKSKGAIELPTEEYINSGNEESLRLTALAELKNEIEKINPSDFTSESGFQSKLNDILAAWSSKSKTKTDYHYNHETTAYTCTNKEMLGKGSIFKRDAQTMYEQIFKYANTSTTKQKYDEIVQMIDHEIVSYTGKARGEKENSINTRIVEILTLLGNAIKEIDPTSKTEFQFKEALTAVLKSWSNGKDKIKQNFDGTHISYDKFLGKPSFFTKTDAQKMYQKIVDYAKAPNP